MCWKCDNPQASDEDFLDEVRRLIELHGWEIIAVPGAGGLAPFAYTVGLAARGVPELVVTCLPADASAALLNEVAPRALRIEPEPGELLLLDSGAMLEAVALPVPGAHLLVAASLVGPSLEALQLVWPDDRGRYPWERGHRGGRGGQPVLGPRNR
jgi:hypothetical protein